jgi:pilus assembly protein FimV
MTRLPRILLSSGLALPLLSYGLGLGKMAVHSALDQPFDAEVEIIDASGTALNQLTVKLADKDSFQRAELQRIAALDALEFKIGEGPNGRPVIRITSQRAITEPFLQLLMEVSWQQGSYLRSYSVLLDPPIASLHSNPKPAVATASISETSKLPDVTPDSGVPTTEPTPVSTPVRATFTEYGKVGKDEQLWVIAKAVSDKNQVTVNQAMLGIVGASPDAFIDGNINGLKQGAALRIPDVATLKSIDPELAKQEVQQQNREWDEEEEVTHPLAAPYYQVSVPAGAIHSAPTFAPRPEPHRTAALLNPAPNLDSEQNPLSANAMFPSGAGPEFTGQPIQTNAPDAAATISADAQRFMRNHMSELTQESKELRKKLQQREQEVALLKAQLNHIRANINPEEGIRLAKLDTVMQDVMTMPRINGQAQSGQERLASESWSHKLLLALLVVITGGAIGLRYWQRRQAQTSQARPFTMATPVETGVLPKSEERAEPIAVDVNVSSNALESSLDLAIAYISMDDKESAKPLLLTVLEEGTPLQQQEAKRLLAEVFPDASGSGH